MRTHDLLSRLRHASLAGFLLLAIGTDICELPLAGQSRGSENAMPAPGLPDRTDPQVSCEGKPAELMPEPTRSPVETETPPLPPPPVPATS